MMTKKNMKAWRSWRTKDHGDKEEWQDHDDKKNTISWWQGGIKYHGDKEEQQDHDDKEKHQNHGD
jgi:hypothetical protein